MFFKIILALLMFTVAPECKPLGKVFVVTGNSSAGKTSTCEELKNLLGDDYEFVNGDIFVWNKIAEWVESQTKHKLPRDNPKQIAEQISSLGLELKFSKKNDPLFRNAEKDVFQHAKELETQGKNVICDVVLANEESWKVFFDELNDVDVKLILLYCPISTLTQRVNMRNEKILKQDKPHEARPLYLALEQFGDIYKKSEKNDNSFIDELSLQELDDICTLAEKDFKSDVMDKFFSAERLKTAHSDLVTKLDLKDKKIIHLTPREKYDLIINSGEHSIHECAKQIELYLSKINLVEEHLNVEKHKEI